MDKERRCKMSDGRERCCLITGYPNEHMGCYYTMKQDEVDRFMASISRLSELERRAQGL